MTYFLHCFVYRNLETSKIEVDEKVNTLAERVYNVKSTYTTTRLTLGSSPPFPPRRRRRPKGGRDLEEKKRRKRKKESIKGLRDRRRV